MQTVSALDDIFLHRLDSTELYSVKMLQEASVLHTLWGICRIRNVLLEKIPPGGLQKGGKCCIMWAQITEFLQGRTP